PSGDSPAGGIIRDVDEDGIADFYYGQSSPNAIVLRRGTGGGTLGPETLYALSSKPHSIGLGDLNGDSIPDVLAVSDADPQFTTYLADGNGDLVTSTTLTIGGSVESWTLWDF